MPQKEYEDLIIQDNVFSEELMDNLTEIVKIERVVKTLGLVYPRITYDRTANSNKVVKTPVPVSKLKQTPIPQPAGVSVQQYYKFGLSKQEADSLLYVIRQAMNNRRTPYKPDKLQVLEQKWQRYCDSFG